ncbi:MULTISPECIES: ABC transporter permease subunit [Rossellomorea]|uniref:ABC transporter permease subunit n=1 Tax=Rossellomorea TaxID=2837508 RepID=UPI001CCA1044|nr:MULTISPECIES: ABC transporter permease subunit [Rossellomorea]MCA0149637.1 ABC transporter permease subunit [Rossellomorea vietnamensis]WGG46563.1 ABC transporter permease subunit [Rossellomorea sp. DA94]
MNKALRTPLQFVIVFVGLFLLSGISALLDYDTELVINVGAYGLRLWDTILELASPSSIVVLWGAGNKKYGMFEIFSSTYPYSFTILFISFLAAIIISVVASYLMMLMPRKLYRASEKVVNVLDGIPDVFLVVLFQLFIIWLFKRTDVLLFDIYTTGEEKIYTLPVICLSFLPVVFLVKQFLFQLKEEEGKPYVEFSYSKGFKKSYTIWFHVFRNVWIHFFLHLKPIFLLMLSNLLVIEILFNIKGFMTVLLRTATSSSPAFFVGMLLIFVPFYIVFTIGSLLLKKWLKGGEYNV